MGKPATEEGDIRHSKRAKVLVVDDDHGFRDMIAFTLSQRGFSVTTAADGAEALEALASERPDLVIMDLMMPGMDGYELLRRIQADPTISARTIVVSAEPEVDLCHLPVSAYLPKPFGSRQLIWLVERILEGSSTAERRRTRSMAA